jgi:hypothetical protein
MTGSIDVQTPAQGDEKAVMQHQEHIHKRDADGSSNEAGLHESEKNIPVRIRQARIKVPIILTAISR